jgi:hypothetical protein
VADPLVQLTRWKVQETALEVGAPMIGLGAAWTVAYRLAVLPSGGRPLTPVELSVMIVALGAVTGWAISRQLFLAGRRRPGSHLIFGLIIGFLILAGMRAAVTRGFASRCADPIGGVTTTLEGQDRTICLVGGVPGNPYLPGTQLMPTWGGELPPWTFVLYGLALTLGALALRDRRVLPTTVVHNMHDKLRLAAAVGTKGVVGGLGKNGGVVACGNSTLWGEPCGQLYSADKKWEHGEWCVRCRQLFVPNERSITFTLVSLFTGDIDVLNTIERLDTVSWPRDKRKPPDARISGQERWVILGQVTLPDVISVAQALALIHDQLPKLDPGKDPRVSDAIKLAAERASRLCCWFWYGRFNQRLTYARPSSRARFAFGSQRLRDVLRDAGADVVLQLDIGLLPVEVRFGFRQTFREPWKQADEQNSKQDLWVPVAPSGKAAATGLWVDRIEGEALRAWLSTERRREAEARGVSTPLPYQSSQPGDRRLPANPDAPLDYVRVSYLIERDRSQPDREGAADEPGLVVASPDTDVDLTNEIEIASAWAAGDSIAEWEWLEWRQVELLRQQCLALVPYEEAR